MILAAGLIASRFVHYLALSALFGGTLFWFYGFAPASLEARAFPAWLHRMLVAAAGLALASAVFWFAFTAAGMTGNLAGMFDPGVLLIVVRDTGFGRVWVFRLIVAVVLVMLLLRGMQSRRRVRTVLLGAVVLLSSIALTGHVGADASVAGPPRRFADTFHLSAAAAWIGALLIFARLSVEIVRGPTEERLAAFHYALARFSNIGSIAVATLILSGIANPGFLISLDSDYGRLLFAKLMLFATMLLLAAVNRFWLTPRLEAAMRSGAGTAAALAALRVSLLAETGLAVVVVLAVAWLGTLAPPG